MPDSTPSGEAPLSAEFIEIRVYNTGAANFADVSRFLSGIDGLYGRFVEKEYKSRYAKKEPFDKIKIPELTVADKHLYLCEVRPGSVIIKAMGELLPWFQTLWENRDAIVSFVGYFKGAVDHFKKGATSLPERADAKDVEYMKELMRPVVNQNWGINIGAITTGDNSPVTLYNLTPEEAQAAGRGIAGYLEMDKSPAAASYKKQLLRWVQARFDAKPVGDRAIIESIAPKAMKTIWEDPNDKALTMNMSVNDKPWQQLAYLVDVDVQTIEGKPKLYTITRVYIEETFDPED